MWRLPVYIFSPSILKMLISKGRPDDSGREFTVSVKLSFAGFGKMLSNWCEAETSSVPVLIVLFSFAINSSLYTPVLLGLVQYMLTV